MSFAVPHLGQVFILLLAFSTVPAILFAMCSHADSSIPLWIVELSNSRKRMVFSASRIGTWMACHRKSGWEKFAGYIAPPSAANNKGTAVHSLLEAWRADESLVDLTTEEGSIAGQIMRHWPPHVEGESSEAEFRLQGRHAWMGYKDLQLPGMVVDFKTTSDFRWMKTEKDLQLDPQAIIYAHDYFSGHPTEEIVALRWIYGRTRAPHQARVLDTTMTRPHAALGFAALESYADEMQAAADACPPLQGEPGHDPVAVHKYVLTMAPTGETTNQCDAYGGCPHKGRCNIPMFRDKKESKPVNVLERMLQMNQAEAAAQTSTPAPAAPVNDALALLMGITPAAAPVVNGPGNAWKPPSPLEYAPPSVTETAKGLEMPVAGVDYAQTPAAEAAAINPPRRAGRPAGSKNKPKDPTPDRVISSVMGAADAVLKALVPAEPLPALPVAEASRELATLLATPAPPPIPVPATGKAITTLVVGAVVYGRDFVDFDNILAKAKDMIGDAAYFGGFGYKTNGMMLEAVQRILGANPVDTLVVKSVPQVDMLSYLRANASVLVEAIR